MSLTAPYRPLPISVFNRIAAAANRVGLGRPLNAEQLLEAASNRTGLNDFGPDKVLEPLQMLTESIESQAKLHPFGHWVIRTRLRGLLEGRLRAMELVRQHPEIAQEQIKAPLIIAGLQRTGTTMLHRLLAADPDNRALLSWEALDPLPPRRAGMTDPRIRSARTAERGLRYLAPAFFAIHPVEAESPEEDVLLMEFSLRSQVPEAMLNVPSFANWLDTQDSSPSYDWLHRMLQILQWQRRGRRWVLKTPAHLENLHALFERFPDARIIQTHRCPQETAASFASMLSHGYGIFSDAVDPHAIAQHWTRKNARMVTRALAVRHQRRGAFFDVDYRNLLTSPMVEVERIYQFAGLDLSEEARRAMQAACAINRQHKYGHHSYELSDFGLTAGKINELFESYIQHFSLDNASS